MTLPVKSEYGRTPRPVRVMGILNVTPDSFSDGGAFLDSARAIEHGHRLIELGADIVDVGPESTRPGSKPVDAEEQMRRAAPVIRALREGYPSTSISIDTTQARVAAAAVEAGADMVNDTSALRDDPAMAGFVAEAGVSIVLMHRRGTPDTMQDGGGPNYVDVVGEIRSFLSERAVFALERGIDPSRIIVDPGIGFGKRHQDNLAILGHAGQFGHLACGPFAVLIGASRKRFLGEMFGIDDPGDRDRASVMAATVAVQRGAALVRVHDVGSTVAALKMLAAVDAAVRSSGCEPVVRASKES